MTIVNLTPHPIVLVAADGWPLTFPSSGVCRVTTTPGTLSEVEGIPVPVAGAPTFGDIEGLPEPEDGTVFIVSGMVASALVQRGIRNRPDVLVPGTGPQDGAVRDAEGRIVGVTRLVRATPEPALMHITRT